MSRGAQASLLPDGQRLHLHHGPIDLIIGVEATDQDACFSQAVQRFNTVLAELSEELPSLRRTVSACRPNGRVARRMHRVVWPHRAQFVTPMAAVAGAVADEVLAALIAGQTVRKAYVNNGGDIAFHLSEKASFCALGPAGKIDLEAGTAARGVATSGWRGRSYSRGIADAVTVIAENAAQADVAATLIANAVDLPAHRAIRRCAACALSPDSDLGARLVTTNVGDLSENEVRQALRNGLKAAQDMRGKRLILQAVLSLKGKVAMPEEKEVLDA